MPIDITTTPVEVEYDDELPDPSAGMPGMVAWVEGRAKIPTWLPDKRDSLDNMRKYAAELGLHVFMQTTLDEDASILRPKRRRWTSRRVSLDEITALTSTYPGIRVDDVVDQLYHTDPWTEAAQRQALAKLRVATYHLGPAKIVSKYDRDNVERLYPPSAVPGTPSAARVIKPLDLPFELPYDELVAASRCMLRYLRMLQRCEGGIETMLKTDPSWVQDVVRETLKAIQVVRASAAAEGAERRGETTTATGVLS
jgi:hypothetical protein